MTFSDLLYEVAARQGHALPPARHPEPLAALDYPAELELKRAALAAFWRRHELPREPRPVVAAPLPRGYRTTTKRRAEQGRRGLTLGFPGVAARSGVAPSALDLPAHGALYAYLHERLARPPARALAAALNWLIVRGPAAHLAVLCNVRRFDADVVRGGKRLAEDLAAAGLGVGAAFLYLDPSGSDYYLEARRPETGLAFKRLFGPEWLQVAVDDVRLRFPPTVFSQVNEAMLPTMTAAVRELLGPLGERTLLDLYCGYGLFALAVGRAASDVIGIDYDGPAIAAARGNAEHLRCAGRVRFRAGRIDGALLASVRPARRPEVVLLDPPRQGTAPDVVPALAARQPERAVHICCGIDELPREIAAWETAGYHLRQALPLDLFAGTAGLETLLLFAR